MILRLISTAALADNSGAYKIAVSAQEYTPIVVGGRDWYDQLAYSIEHKRKCIYFIDDESFIATAEFAHLFRQDSYSFFVIINRFVNISSRSMGQLSFA